MAINPYKTTSEYIIHKRMYETIYLDNKKIKVVDFFTQKIDNILHNVFPGEKFWHTNPLSSKPENEKRIAIFEIVDGVEKYSIYNFLNSHYTALGNITDNINKYHDRKGLETINFRSSPDLILQISNLMKYLEDYQTDIFLPNSNIPEFKSVYQIVRDNINTSIRLGQERESRVCDMLTTMIKPHENLIRNNPGDYEDMLDGRDVYILNTQTQGKISYQIKPLRQQDPDFGNYYQFHISKKYNNVDFLVFDDPDRGIYMFEGKKSVFNNDQSCYKVAKDKCFLYNVPVEV
jgi:hypothetical protein